MKEKPDGVLRGLVAELAKRLGIGETEAATKLANMANGIRGVESSGAGDQPQAPQVEVREDSPDSGESLNFPVFKIHMRMIDNAYD